MPRSAPLPRCILHGGLSSFPPSTLLPPFRGILRRTKAAKEITKESPSGASRVDETVFTFLLIRLAAKSIYMSSVRKNVIVRRHRSMTREYPSALFSLPPPPLLHSPRNLSRPFQLRDKGLLRYRLHPPTRGSSSRSANKTPWPCFTRDIKRVATALSARLATL